jgi:hypothetical protein
MSSIGLDSLSNVKVDKTCGPATAGLVGVSARVLVVRVLVVRVLVVRVLVVRVLVVVVRRPSAGVPGPR